MLNYLSRVLMMIGVLIAATLPAQAETAKPTSAVELARHDFPYESHYVEVREADIAASRARLLKQYQPRALPPDVTHSLN